MPLRVLCQGLSGSAALYVSCWPLGPWPALELSILCRFHVFVFYAILLYLCIVVYLFLFFITYYVNSVYWLSCLILFVLFLIILLIVSIYCRMTRLLKKQHPKIKVGMQLNQIMMMIKLKVDAQFTTLFFGSVVHLRCHYRCAIFTWYTA